MMKTKLEKVIASGGFLLLLTGSLFCCFGIQFPFINAKSDLNNHLTKDFSVKLPPSANVLHAYWVGSRDPENVYALDLAPAEIAPFIDVLTTAATAKGHTKKVAENIARFGPLYRTPLWWNNPPLLDPQAIEFQISISGASGISISSHYRFLFSPTTGRMYVVWGEF